MNALEISQKEMQRAHQHNDASYNGIFFLAVKTTGIFCTPSCTARKPLSQNIEYYRSAKEALFAGYRPCKRCHPLDLNGTPEWVKQLFNLVESNPTSRQTDATIREMGIDPARARRYFLKRYGMTFQAYCRARRLGKSLEQIRKGTTLDEAALGFGYESHGGFREAFSRLFGIPPGKSRSTDCIAIAWMESPLGPLLAGATSKSICFLEFTDRRMMEAQCKTLSRRFGKAIVPGMNGHLSRLQQELNEYFDGARKQFSVALDFPGTSFQQKVWNELLKIPYGKTISYEELARRIDSPGAVRAVGTANGMNRIAILIPCHRVVNKNGKLGGYGGGLRRKEALLQLEQQV